jgi:hypothetical protein
MSSAGVCTVVDHEHVQDQVLASLVGLVQERPSTVIRTSTDRRRCTRDHRPSARWLNGAIRPANGRHKAILRRCHCLRQAGCSHARRVSGVGSRAALLPWSTGPDPRLR